MSCLCIHLKEDSLHLRENSLHFREDSLLLREDSLHLGEDTLHLREETLHIREDIDHLGEDDPVAEALLVPDCPEAVVVDGEAGAHTGRVEHEDVRLVLILHVGLLRPVMVANIYLTGDKDIIKQLCDTNRDLPFNLSLHVSFNED